MIHQIASIPQTPTPAEINRDLATARLVQAKLKSSVINTAEVENGLLWSPNTTGPFLVPILRWIE